MKKVYQIQNNEVVNVVLVEDSFICDNVMYFDSVDSNVLDPKGFAVEFAQPSQQTLTQYEKDFIKYQKRAAIKDIIISEMAAENMQRVRAGVWTVSQLIELTQDVELKHVLDDVNTLSFELAQAKINALTNPLITAEIKTNWIVKLQNYLYNS